MFSSEQWLANSGADFYNGVALTSLRLDPHGDYLTKTFSTPISRKIMSFGGWVKRYTLGKYSNLFSGTLGGSGVEQSSLHFDTDDKLKIMNYTGSSYVFDYATNRLFRDSSAWYHLWVELDSTQGNNATADRVKIYVNGVRETSFSTASLIADGTPDIQAFNKNGVVHYFGHSNGTYGGGVHYSDWYFIDGTAVSPIDTVGEFKNGVFIPKAYAPTFGNNGFHLEFKESGIGTGASNTCGADTSLKNNHFTSTGVDLDDTASPNSPENNFPSMNPLDVGGAITYSNGNNFVYPSSGSMEGTRATQAIPQSGKFYWEVRLQAVGYICQLGIATAEKNLANTGDNQPDHVAWGFGTWFNGNNSSVSKYQVNVGGSSGTNWVAVPNSGDIVGIAYDADGGNLWFSKNGTWQNTSGTANPSTGADPRATGLSDKIWFPLFAGYVEGPPRYYFNYGADPSFVGGLTGSNIGEETPSEGAGVFKYAVPTGFKSLCSANIPEPTIGANSTTQADDHFTPYIWTGNDSNPRAFTDVGFQADWIWIKKRSGAGTSHHLVADSSRGDGKTMLANEPNVEATNDANGTVSDTTTVGGFTVNAGSTSDEMVNDGSDTYVAWLWKCNAGVTTTNDASSTGIGTIDSVYQANTDAGFSIVTYTGTGSSGSIAHGLKIGTTATAPDFVIIKKRNASNRWFAWHKDDPIDYFYLNESYAGEPSGFASRFGNDSAITQPSTTLLTLGTNTDVNASNTYVAYCFSSVESYSKFGSYIGNGSATNGSFVYLGFRASFIMTKSTASGNWVIFDTTRDTHNTTGKYLLADSADTEGDTGTNTAGHVFDILSNGFKLRNTNAGRNSLNVKYIYMAFADSVGAFKYANAR